MSDTNQNNRTTFLMKDFLYLDMDFLESFIAQRDKGFKYNIIREDGSSATEAKGSKSITGGIGYGNMGVSIKSGPVSNTDTSTSKDVYSMQQREYMFNAFLESEIITEDGNQPLVKNLGKKLTKENLEASKGKYILSRAYFDFISLSRLEDLTTSEMQNFYMHKKKSFSTNAIREIRENIVQLRTLFPFNSFLTTENAIVLMDEEPLREGNKQTGYKFSNDVVVVGKVNRRTGVRDASAPANRLLDKIQLLAISLLCRIGILDKDNPEIYFIRPIAIYWEQEICRKDE